jgi:Family of unknown function (DUF5361)
MGRNRVVGIAGLGDILKEHWGAVGRDLICAGYTWDDVGSERFPIDQFASFVAYAPPGTALFHQRNRGWSTSDYLAAQMIDALHYLVWMETDDARKKNPKHRPVPIPRPGIVTPSPQADDDGGHQTMTVAEYTRRSGLNIELEGR